MMGYKPDPKILAELRAGKEPHGELIYCSCSHFSGGMMANSTSSSSISVRKKGEYQYITISSKQAFGDTFTSEYRTKNDVLGKARELIDRENLAAWSELEYVDLFKATDVSSSSGISLTFDDSSIGGSVCTIRNIDLRAVGQHGAGEVGSELEEILRQGSEGAELLETRKGKESEMMGGMLGYSMTYDDGWRCANCGTLHNKGKFCVECGARGPEEDGWKCPSCGQAGNKSKFCPECGMPKPE